jgi:predicted HTH transcriptional regulator
MEIGRRDDGEVVGVINFKKLLEDLPNKIRSATGVIPAVDLRAENGKEYISVSVKPYTFPISCNGRYYLRSGSTTQELSGSSLDEFMLRIQGKTWDGVPVPYVKFDDFESDAAIIHRDYSTGNPIHIHIYPNKVLIYNDGRLPEDWAVEKLVSTHTSMPHNPLIAGAFFRSGQIEAWGRGIEKITDSCKSWGKPEPFYEVHSNDVMIGFNTGSQFGEKFGENQTQVKVLEIMLRNPKVSAKTIGAEMGITTRGVEKVIHTLKEAA